MTTSTIPTHIIFTTHNRKNQEIAFKGSLEECQNELKELGETGYDIVKNEIKDSWDNEVEGIHYDLYMDDSTDSRAIETA